MKKLKQTPSIVEFVVLYLFILPYNYESSNVFVSRVQNNCFEKNYTYG